jgi:hypothetical protein
MKYGFFSPRSPNFAKYRPEKVLPEIVGRELRRIKKEVRIFTKWEPHYNDFPTL